MENAWPAHIERNSLKSRLASITMWTNCWPAHWHKFDLKKNKMHCRSVDGQLGPWPFKYLLQTEFVWWTFLFFLLFCSVLHVTGCSWFTGPLVQESQRSQSKHESTSNAHVDSRQRGYEIQKLRKSSGALSAVLYRHFDTAIYRQQVCARSEYRTKKIPAKIQKKNRIVKGILALVHTHRLQFSLPHEIYATYRYRLTFISSSAAAANAAVATTTAIASTNSKSWLKDFSCVFKIFATELSTRTPEFWLISSSHSSFVVLHNLFAEKKPQDAGHVHARTGAVECALNLFRCRFDALKIQQIWMNVYGTPCYLYLSICVRAFFVSSFVFFTSTSIGRHCQIQKGKLAYRQGSYSYTVCNRVKSPRLLE